MVSMIRIVTYTPCTHSSLRVEQCRSFRDFNDVLILPMFGYKDKDELYHDCSAYHRVEDFTVPVVALNSADDPFCPPDGEQITALKSVRTRAYRLPKEVYMPLVRKNDHVPLVLATSG